MATSIFSIDIDDAKAKAYFALVEKYQQNLAKLPGMWGKVAQAEQPVVAALAAQTQLLQRVADGEKQVAREAQRAAGSWSSISRSAKETAESLARIGLTVAKWTGITSALSAVVGAVTLDRMAEAVAGGRRVAGGLGITYGQQASFGLNLGRFVDPSAVLSAGRNALYDITNPAFVALRAAGLSQEQLAGGNAATVSAALLERLPGLFAGTPRELVGPRARSLGLDQFFSLDDIVRFLDADPEERRTQIARFRQDAGNLNLRKDVTRGWQDFNTGLERAGLNIENTLVERLVGLTGPLEKLAGSVAKATDTFLAGAEKWIGPFGDAIERFAKYLVSPDFEDDLKSFKDNVGEVVAAIGGAAKWIRSITPNVNQATSTALGPIDAAMADTAARVYGPATRHFTTADIQKALAKGVHLPPTWLKGMSQVESDFLSLIGQVENAKRDPNAVSSSGDVGLYQINPKTARDLGYDPARLTDPEYNTQAALHIIRTIFKDAATRYHGDPDKMILAYHRPGAAAGTVPMLASDRTYVERAHGVPGYQKLIIEIHDATGASAVKAGSQIGQGGTP